MLETMKRKAVLAMIRMRSGLMDMEQQDQEGMEIIQVLVLLALALVLVGLFITFSDQITRAVQEKVDEFMESFKDF